MKRSRAPPPISKLAAIAIHVSSIGCNGPVRDQAANHAGEARTSDHEGKLLDCFNPNSHERGNSIGWRKRGSVMGITYLCDEIATVRTDSGP